MSRPTVLITGGYGFVGQNLWDYILAQRSLRERFNFIRTTRKGCDLLSLPAIDKVFTKSKPEYIIHLAAMCGGIGANQLYPAIFWNDNLQMSMNLMKAAMIYDIKKIVTLGTVCSYGKNTPVPFKETDLYTELPEITNRPYGVAKYAIYEGLRAYNTQFNLPFTYLIPTNMYGLHDNYGQQNSHVIPAIMIAMHKAKLAKKHEILLWGDGTPTRDFLYARDCVKAIITSLETDTGNQPINLGTGEEVTMSTLAEMIASVVGYKGDIIWNKDKPNGQPRRMIDSTKAKELLMWEAETKLINGLKETYEWFSAPEPEPKTTPKAKHTEEE